MIKVLIADDHAVVRHGLKQILGDTLDMLVGGEAEDGQQVLDKVHTESWDVVILDITMPILNGLEVLKQLKDEKPDLPVLILSMHSEAQYVMRALKYGASGFVTKDSAADELIRALHKVMNGGRYVSSFLAEKLSIDIGGDESKLPHELLTDREF